MTVPLRTDPAIVRVALGARSYDIVVGRGLIASLGARIEALRPGSKTAIVTDESVACYHLAAVEAAFAGAGVAASRIIVPVGEGSKSFRMFERVCEAIIAARIERGDLVVALGGGVIGDLAGFAASAVRRGLDYVQVPTTFLSQVDSSVGGKTGVNLPEGKNLVGSFHHPIAVFADIDVLGTLPERELRAGLMESVKAGIIRDRALVRFMEEKADAILQRNAKALERVIATSIRIKANVVNRDERENGLRMILNLGHTVGHAIEQTTRYKVMLHGEAVGWGMIAALFLARRRGTISPQQFQRLENLIHLYGPLPPFKLRPARVVAATGADKKNVGGVRRFVLPVGIGDAGVVEDVSLAELEAAVGYMLLRARGQRS